MGADVTVLNGYEVADKLKNIKQTKEIKLITTRQFKMEAVKEAMGFWRETQPSSGKLSSAELSTEILKTKPHHGATSNLTKWITRLHNLNNFWREKHVDKCSLKTDEKIHIQNLHWTETDKYLSQNEDNIKNLAREDKYGEDKLQRTIYSDTEPLGKIWMDSTHKKSRNEDTFSSPSYTHEKNEKMEKWRNFFWKKWKWKWKMEISM